MRNLLRLVLVCLLSLGSAAFAQNPAPQNILIYGDSLSAGYGLARDQAWPNLLQARLNESKLGYTVINASISGETTAGGRSRFAAALRQHKPAVVVLELGANDGLRGLPIAEMRANLETMIAASQAAGARVLLIGMRIPPNYGPDYTRDFAAAVPALARQHKTAVVPFLFEKLIGKPGAFLPDNLHPTAASQPLLLDTIWPQLKPLLRRA